MQDLSKRCADCNSTALLDDFREGCIVCTNCGLVASPWLLDDRPVVDVTRNLHWSTACSQVHALRDACFRSMGEMIPNKTLHAADEMYANAILKKNVRRHNTNALRAACIYQSLKRTGQGGVLHNISDVCNMFDVDHSKIMDMTGLLEEERAETTQKHEMTKYHAFSHLIDDRTLRWKMINTCVDVERQVTKQKELANKKPSKMCAALFMCVCMHKYMVRMDMKELSLTSGVSLVTLRKHIRLLKPWVMKLCNVN